MPATTTFDAPLITRPRCATAPRGKLLPALRQTHPTLGAAAWLSLLALVPVLLAMSIDLRTVNGISVWIKPAKFLVSFAVYYATLAWVSGWLSASTRARRPHRFVVAVALGAGVLEMTWLLLAAAFGVPAHFNREQPWATAYQVAGAGAVMLLVAVLVQGVLVARDREAALAPALRHAIVLGAVVAFATTLITASVLSSGDGHWVGGARSDAGGLPLVGWSRTGGDLRVAHFFALHAQQALPLVGLALVALRRPDARAAVWVATAVYTAWIGFTFVQALRGQSLLAMVGLG